MFLQNCVAVTGGPSGKTSRTNIV